MNVARRVRYLERYLLSQFAAQSCTLYSIPRASPPGGQQTEHRRHMACCPSPQYPNPQCHHYHRCVPQQPAADLGSRPRQQPVGGQHPRRGGASRIFTARLPLGSGVMWHTARCVSQEGTTQRRGLHAVLPRRCSFRKRQPCPGGQAVCCCCWCCSSSIFSSIAVYATIATSYYSLCVSLHGRVPVSTREQARHGLELRARTPRRAE